MREVWPCSVECGDQDVEEPTTAMRLVVVDQVEGRGHGCHEVRYSEPVRQPGLAAQLEYNPWHPADSFVVRENSVPRIFRVVNPSADGAPS